MLAVLLFFSGAVSASETAFFSLSPNDVNTLRNKDSRGARAVLSLLGDQDYLLAAILITNNLVNICAVILSNSILDHLVGFGSGTMEFIVKVVLVTFLLLLFGEIMPKVFAAYNGLRLAQVLSGPLTLLKKIFRPVSWLLVRSGNRINESVSSRKANISMDDLSNAIDLTSEDQSLEEKKILSGIVNFIHTEVEEIMKPRVDVVALDREADFGTVCKTVIDSGFSRIPVYQDSMDNIQGILYVKDLIPFIDSGPDFGWQKLIREPYYVPEHKKINDLFAEFQNNKIHIAIVVDEYGSTMGIVSLEDILEEIVGEISDESDMNKSYYTQIAPDTFIFEGKTHILDVLKVLGLDDEYLDEYKGESESLAGLMLETKRDFLKKGDVQTIRGLTLTVIEIEGRRVTRIKVQKSE